MRRWPAGFALWLLLWWGNAFPARGGERPELVVQQGHSDTVNCLAFSPDGRTLATGEDFVKLWDVFAGREFRTVAAHEWADTAAFSADGKFLAVGDNHAAKVTVWDLETARAASTFRLPHHVTTCLAFGPGSATVAMAAMQQDYSIVVGVYDTRSSKVLVSGKPVKSVAAMCFSPDGTRLACALGDHTVQVLDTRTGAVAATLPCEGKNITTLAFSPDGAVLAGGEGAGEPGGPLTLQCTVCLWDASSGRTLRTFGREGGWFVGLAFDPAGGRLVTVDGSGHITVWDAATGKSLKEIQPGRRSAGRVAFSPDGTIFAASSGPETTLYDSRTFETIGTLRKRSPEVRAVAYNPVGNYVASADRDSVKLWANLGGGEYQVFKDDTGPYALVFSADGTQLAAAANDGIIHLHALAAGTVKILQGHTHNITSLAFSPDGTRLASGCGDNTIRLWDTATGETVRTLVAQPGADPRIAHYTNHLVFSHDGKQLFSGAGSFTDDGEIVLRDVATGERVKTLVEKTERISALALSPDGRTLVSSAGTGTIQTWDAATGEKGRAFRVGTGDLGVVEVVGLAFSPDGTVLAAAGSIGTVSLLDPATGAALCTLRGETAGVRSLCFSPDGATLATGGSDATVRLWNARTGEEVVRCIAIGPADFAAVTPDDYYLASPRAYEGLAFRVGSRACPFDQFDLRFNRPDLVLRRVGTAPARDIEQAAKAHRARLAKMGLKDEPSDADFDLPTLRITDDALARTTDRKTFTLHVAASDPRSPLRCFRLLVNGVRVDDPAACEIAGEDTREATRELTLPLGAGDNRIECSVVNAANVESLRATVQVHCTGPAMHRLFVVAVGVSFYQAALPKLNLAAKDARDFAAFWQGRRGDFDDVTVLPLIDAEATREKILNVRDTLRRAGPDDEVIVLFAGHGLLDGSGDYYFGTVDIDPDAPAARGLAYAEIEALLDGVPARNKLLLLDTCHAGEKENEYARRLLDRWFVDLRGQSGVHVIASSSADTAALESSDLGNGVFTSAVLERLRAVAEKRDKSPEHAAILIDGGFKDDALHSLAARQLTDDNLKVSELRDHVLRRVVELTHGAQKPISRQENLENDFALLAPVRAEADIPALRERVETLVAAQKYADALPPAAQLFLLRLAALSENHPDVAASLDRLGFLLRRLPGKIYWAERAFKTVLDLTAKRTGESAETADAAETLLETFVGEKQPANAEPLARRALEIRRHTLGPTAPKTLMSLAWLGTVYHSLHKDAEARAAYTELADLREQTDGRISTQWLTAVSVLARWSDEAGDEAEADRLYESVLPTLEKLSGPESGPVSDNFCIRGLLKRNLGQYDAAQTLLERALALREKLFGAVDIRTAWCQRNLAAVYQLKDQPARAEPLYRRALEVRRIKLGPQDAAVAESLEDLARNQRRLEHHKEAIALYEELAALKEKIAGADAPTVANTLLDLANASMDATDPARAVPALERALAIRQKSLPPDDPKVAAVLKQLAGVLAAQGKFADGLVRANQSLDILSKTDSQSEEFAEALAIKGTCCFETGDFSQAERALQKAIELKSRPGVTPDRFLAASYAELLALYYSAGDFPRAEPMLDRALEVAEKVFSPDSQPMATMLAIKAMMRATVGKFPEANAAIQRAVEIDEKTLGAGSMPTCYCILLAGFIDVMEGDRDRAEIDLRRAVAGMEAMDPNYSLSGVGLALLATIHLDRGDFAQAETELKRGLAVVQQHSIGYLSLFLLRATGYVKLAEGDRAAAGDYARQAARAQDETFGSALSMMQEADRLKFQEQLQQGVAVRDLFGTLGAAPELAALVLREKGAVLDSLIEDRLMAEASKDPAVRALTDQLRAAQRRVTPSASPVSRGTVAPAAANEADANAARAEVEVLRTKLAQAAGPVLGRARSALAVTPAQVQAVLPPQTALVEYVRYREIDTDHRLTPAYGALILAPSAAPVWQALGPAQKIDAAIARYQGCMHGRFDAVVFEKVEHALHASLWEPVERQLPHGCTRVVLSPDGDLNFVSFAALADAENRFVAERYSVGYVSSGRDLLLDPPPARDSTVAIFADPRFARPSGESVPSPAGAETVAASPMGDLRFDDLPGTKQEAAGLLEKVSARGWSPQVFSREAANKPAFYAIRSPRVLHLATHGFFVPDKPDSTEATSFDLPTALVMPTAAREDPMRRAGLALAGARDTVAAWAKNERPAPEDDGIVTAGDVATIDLRGTWLVTLSACDTGAGESRAGEGVIGLRRGFVEAGAQNLLMTLWPVRDDLTVRIMLDFYDRAFETGNAPRALAETQGAWLVKLRDERGLLQAVQAAGPFIMSSQGSPK